MYYRNYTFVQSLTIRADPVSSMTVSLENNQSDEQTFDGRLQFGSFYTEPEEYRLQNIEQVFIFQLVNVNIKSSFTNPMVYCAVSGCYLQFWAHLLVMEVNLEDISSSRR